MLGLIFIWWKMSFPSPVFVEDSHDPSQGSWRSKLRRIDFFGSISLGLANCSLLIFLDQVQRSADVIHDLFTLLPLSTWIGSLAIFIAMEAFWVREPILPLRLLANRNVFSSYSIQFL